MSAAWVRVSLGSVPRDISGGLAIIYLGMYRVVKVARDESELEQVRLACERELKDLLWREVWRDMVELEGVEERVVDVGGFYEVTLEIKDRDGK